MIVPLVRDGRSARRMLSGVSSRPHRGRGNHKGRSLRPRDTGEEARTVERERWSGVSRPPPSVALSDFGPLPGRAAAMSQGADADGRASLDGRGSTLPVAIGTDLVAIGTLFLRSSAADRRGSTHRERPAAVGGPPAAGDRPPAAGHRQRATGHRSTGSRPQGIALRARGQEPLCCALRDAVPARSDRTRGTTDSQHGGPGSVCGAARPQATVRAAGGRGAVSIFCERWSGILPPLFCVGCFSDFCPFHPLQLPRSD